MRARSTLTFLVLSLSLSACIERCAPERVGPGVARLTVRNVGAIVQLINDDPICGFESDSVQSNPLIEGESGKTGSVTWTTEQCDISIGEMPQIDYDCRQVANSKSGRVVVSAKRTVVGTLTGDPAQPVIPLTPDAVTIELTEVRFEDFKVQASNSDNTMTQKRGTLSAIAKPRLAADTENGVCQIATPNIEISEIKYNDAVVHLNAEGRSFDVNVGSSDFRAVNGVHGDYENFIEGQISVWGKAVNVGTDDGNLDPDYDAAKFLEGFACEDKLELPVNFECANIGPVLAQGAARLTIRTLGAIAQAAEVDENCGFTSEPVLSAIQSSGAAGEQGQAQFRVEECTVTFPPDTVLKTSCTGRGTQVSGSFTFTANKYMHGRLTGNLTQPVVPMDDHPVRFEFESIRFDNFVVSEDGKILTSYDGVLAGEITPRTAMDLELTACGGQTSIARMENVRYVEPSNVRIVAEEGTFETALESADLRAVNGYWDGEENVLTGSFALYGETFTLPTDPRDDGLDPEYDREAFDASWKCAPIATDAPFDCRFGAPLAQGAAQLGAQTLGNLASILEENDVCGFSSEAVMFNPQISGTLGDPGGVGVFTIDQPCALTYTEPTVVREDCNGKKTYAQGTAMVTGTKTLRGYVSGDPVEPIVPTDWDPAEINISATFQNFKMWTEPGDNSLEIATGQLGGTVRPRTAIDTVTGACSIPTAVVLMDKITYRDTEATIVSAGRTFNVNIGESSLIAVNGQRDGVENSINGTVVLDGDTYQIPISGEGLDPEYDAAAFVASYACEPNIKLPNSIEECNMNKPLGEGVARLIILSMGTVTSLVNGDEFGCAFGAMGTLTSPSLVIGNEGQPGRMEWEIEDCEMSFEVGDDPYDSDCLDRDAYMTGLASVTGRRTVTGIRETISILIFINIESIVPNTRRSVTVDLQDIRFEDFHTYELDPGQETPGRAIRIHSGNVSAIAEPITGENTGEGGGIPAPTAGAFDIPTKVARFRDVQAGPMDVTILFEGKTFNVHVDSANLYAFNGSWNEAAETNTIHGEISVNGELITMAPQGLDPEYDQQNFDERYVCTDNLVGLIPPQ